MTQYAVLIYANDSKHAPDATKEDIADCDQHADQLVSDNAMVLAYALTPRDLATSIRSDGTTAGPFLGANEIVAGFCIIEAPDHAAALAIARTNPVLSEGGGVEVRPVHSGGLVDRPSV